MSEKSFYGNNAGSKARNDLEKIFKENGFVQIGPSLERRFSKRISYYLSAYFKTKKVLRALKKMKGEIIFFQYPVTKGKVINKYLPNICKNNKVVFFAHDIDYIRTKQNYLRKDDEISYLNMASLLVLHNETMINRLVSDGVNKDKIINLGIFDYLSDYQPDSNADFNGDYTIAYAGSLTKAKFVEELNSWNEMDFELHLFGDMSSLEIKNKKIVYEGSFSPEELLKHLNFAFGLVWDGLSIASADDDLLNYTKYNNPHKASAYLAAGLPLIAWKESALAKFIEKEKVGFAIGSLLELNERIKKLNKKDYQTMKVNALNLSKAITSGYYTNSAIKNVLDELNEVGK